MSEWRTIESAPKENAKKFLVLIDGELGIWYRDAYYEPGGRGYVPGLSGWVDQEGLGRYDSPSHWMPLPEPPK